MCSFNQLRVCYDDIRPSSPIFYRGQPSQVIPPLPSLPSQARLSLPVWLRLLQVVDFTPGSATVYYRLQSRLNYSIQSTVYISLQPTVLYSLQPVVYYNIQPTVYSLLQPASYSGLHSWPYFSHEHCLSTPGSLGPRQTQKCGKKGTLGMPL